VEKYCDYVDVRRNDELSDIDISQYDKLLISPGPGLPIEAGDLIPFLTKYAKKISCLGICLGHQALAEVFGSKLLKINEVKHGVASEIINFDKNEIIFKGLKTPIVIGHYHSWVIDPDNIGDQWQITSMSDNLVMSIRHTKFDVKGLQFHPESVMTKEGENILKNWINN
jgi:anthranilate synthase component 2